jgi:hypothetical protein
MNNFLGSLFATVFGVIAWIVLTGKRPRRCQR